MSGHNIAPRPKRSEVEEKRRGRGDKEIKTMRNKKQVEWAHSSDM
jgi:hypothetical protein